MHQNAIRTVDPQTAAGWHSAGDAILVDVREPEEFRAEHIPYAASVPMQAAFRLGEASGLPRGRRIIFQCLAGSRGAQVCGAVAGAFPDREIYNLAGGITAWKGAGLPVVGTTGRGAALPSLFRQVQIAVGSLLLAFLALGWLANPASYAVAAAMAAMLVVAGVTGWCGMAMLLSRMPWNRA
ncbi:rhodanese-like domain-containing protein [Mesorhizobium sp. IMUNJ 23232]|uniref:rhodanese-like domain-containing protein n=1 Tax=Mesorhizobium sp. IMUNJ 23232 TaxID=3376064 RepID=UPI0037A342CD